jgi:HSP20 family protein
MQPAFSSLFENFFGRDTEQFFNLAHVGTGTPAVNVKEDNEAIRVEVAAPGLKKEDFKVTLENGLLTITAKAVRNTKKRTKRAATPRREFSYRGFSRSFTLPNTVEGRPHRRPVPGRHPAPGHP